MLTLQLSPKPASLVFICCLIPATTAVADELKVSTAINYFYGDYDKDDKTEISHTSINIKYTRFPWFGKLDMPYLKINGFGGIDGNGNVIGDGTGERVKNKGIGDISAQLGYYYVPPFESSWIKLTTKIKLPTADEKKGLGTGELDYSLEAQFIKKIDSFTPFTTIGYTEVGKTAESILNDRFYGNIGTVYRAKPRVDIGAMYTYKEPSSDKRNSDKRIIAFLSWKLPESNWTIDSYALKGLTNASPDAGAGFSLSYRYK